ncbi:MAG: Asp23/Gls24 family envelope stress response protein [Propionibacteriaceae bacterium]
MSWPEVGPEAGPLGSDGRVTAAHRGSLTIERGAIEKIASQAAAELTGVGRATSGIAGLGGHGDLFARPKVVVALRGTRASIAMTIGARYPAPLVDLASSVRRRCAEQVHQLTGLQVDRVDVTIGWLGQTTRQVTPR